MTQACGSQPLCFQQILDPSTDELVSVMIPCDSDNPIMAAMEALEEENKKNDQKDMNRRITFLVIGIIVVFILGGLFLLYFAFKK